MGALAYTDERWRITSARYEEMIAAGAFTDEDKVELLEGEVLPKSPLGEWHFVRSARTLHALRAKFGSEWMVLGPAPIVLGDASQPEPDVIVARASDLLSGKPRWAALVIEIADTSLRRDRRKAALYASGQIPEYWIVNRPDDVVEVHREPIPAPTSPTGFEYRSVQMMRRGESIQALQSTGPVTVDELLGEPSDLP